MNSAAVTCIDRAHMDLWGFQAIYHEIDSNRKTKASREDFMRALVQTVESAVAGGNRQFIAKSTGEKTEKIIESSGKSLVLDDTIFSFQGTKNKQWTTNLYSFETTALEALNAYGIKTSQFIKTSNSGEEQLTLEILDFPCITEAKSSLFECYESAIRQLQCDSKLQISVGEIDGQLHFSNFKRYTIVTHDFVKNLEKVADKVYDMKIQMKIDEPSSGLFGHDTYVSGYSFTKMS